MDIPPMSYQCIFSDRASEVSYGNSVEFMKATDSSVTHEGSVSGGYSGSFSVSVEASYRNARSSSMAASRAQREEGNDRQMQTSAIATLYTYAIRTGEEKEFLSEEFLKDLAAIDDWPSTFEFFKNYGTHYMKRAKMGARYQENISFNSKATEEEISEAKSRARNDAFSASVSGGGWGFEASASYSGEIDSKSESEEKKSSSRSDNI